MVQKGSKNVIFSLFFTIFQCCKKRHFWTVFRGFWWNTIKYLPANWDVTYEGPQGPMSKKVKKRQKNTVFSVKKWSKSAFLTLLTLFAL